MARNRDSADRAGIGPDPDRGGRLVSIDRLHDFRIAKGDVDIRGWEVRTLGGRQLGSVRDLLVDPEAGEVVMMEIALARDDRHTLAPLRAAQLDRERRCVIIDSADVDALAARRAEREEAAPRDDDETYRRAPRERSHSDDRATVHAGDDEVVVERRPVVYEEVVVRRKNVDGEAGADETVDRPSDSRNRDEPRR